MLSIRLSRVGTKKAPVYRVVVMPKHNDPWAKSTEILGHYNPRKTPSELVLNADRVKYWLGEGAQATDTVWNLLIDKKIVEGEKRGVTTISKKRKSKLDEKAAAKAEKVKEATEAAKTQVQAPVEKAPVEEVPVEETPVEESPVEETPAEEPAAETETPAEEPAKEEASAEKPDAEESTPEEKPAE
jgi:small subunit ribosomal protein S16